MNAMYLSELAWKGKDKTTKFKNKYSIHIKNSTKQNTAIIISFLCDYVYVGCFVLQLFCHSPTLQKCTKILA